MKRLSIIAMLAALMLCIGSCGNNNVQQSKQYKAMEEEIQLVENEIMATTICDDLSALEIGIMGLRSDLDNLMQSAEISDAEINQLEERLTQLEATLNGRRAALECDQMVSDQEMDTSGEEDDFME